MNNDTHEYYELNAEEYARTTLDIDMSVVYERFLKHLPSGSYILDAGCGSGRDMLYFINHGYKVSGFDFSSEMCRLSTQLTGVKTRLLRFQDFNEVKKYDGIWACASLLHLQEIELFICIKKLIHALKNNGIMYMSFKYGTKERLVNDGRHFIDMDGNRIKHLIEEMPNIKLKELYVGDCDKRDLRWINIILQKK